MVEPKFWFLKCKICKKLHRSDIIVMDSPNGPYHIPAYGGPLECPDNPGKKADYNINDDWVALTEAELNDLRKPRK